MKKIAVPKKLKKRVAKMAGHLKSRVTKGVKTGAKKLRDAERRGDLEKWKTRVALGVQAIEVATIAAAAAKGIRVSKGGTPAKRRSSSPRKRSR